MKTNDLTPGMIVLLGQNNDRFAGVITQGHRPRLRCVIFHKCQYYGPLQQVDLHNNPHRGNPTGNLGHTNGKWDTPIEVLEILAQHTLPVHPELRAYPTVAAWSAANKVYDQAAADLLTTHLLQPITDGAPCLEASDWD